MDIIAELLLYYLFDVLFFSKETRKERRERRKQKREEKNKRGKFFSPSLVISIILLIALLGYLGNLYFTSKRVKISATTTEMHEIEEALIEYKSESGHYPSTLVDLMTNRPLRKSWLKDGWGIAYHYEVIDDGMNFRLISAGKDKSFWTKDDIIFP